MRSSLYSRHARFPSLLQPPLPIVHSSALVTYVGHLVFELVADDVPPADHLSDGKDTVSLDGL